MSDPAVSAPVFSAEPVDWTEAGPISPRFGDVYFSAVDGLDESRAVFLQGCGLPGAWAGRRRFVVAELGFGTGLNILALLQLWAAHRPSPEARLSIVSIEGFPLDVSDAAKALARWPELAPFAEPLLQNWPRGRRGRHRIEWPDLGATLDLIVDDVIPALDGWTGAADAWFLDGFAPAKNPQMWSDEVLAGLRARSAPGARLATFTVAGAVRRGLEAQGFAVEKRPGFGRKRERLEVRDPSPPRQETPLPTLAVVGAGIAGASLFRALRLARIEPLLVETTAPGAGASGNAAALVTPRLDAGGGVVARLHAEAFARAVALYDLEAPGAVIARGAFQLQQAEKDAGRFPRIAAFEGFDPGSVTPVTANEAAKSLGEPVAPAGLLVSEGLVVEPPAVIDAWLAQTQVKAGRVTTLEPSGGGWRLLDELGGELCEVEVVVFAAGAGLASLAPALAMRAVRGQASTAEIAFWGSAAAWGGYAIPTRTGVLYGASHVPADETVEPRAEEAADNLLRLAQARPTLAAQVAALPPADRAERASTRASLPGHLPVAGALPGAPGVFVLGGLGARGFTLAPLLAEHVAALIIGAPSPLDQQVQAAVSPARAPAQRRAPSVAGTGAPTPRSASAPTSV